MRSSSPRSIERARPLLGTVVAIRATGPAAALTAAVNAAFAAVLDVEQRMSFHDATSDLSRINRLAHVEPQRVHATTFRVLQAALALARASDGVFDPAVGARLVASGHLPSPAPGAPLASTWRDVELRAGCVVAYRRTTWLDLGGIAKGYAVDRAVRVLRAAGMAQGVVNAGGDLRAFGDVNETVHVRVPGDSTTTRPLLELRNGAVATSAGYFSERLDTDGHPHTALIDPRSGRSLGHRVSVSVCAPRAIWADALTKVVLADPAGSTRLLRRLRAQAVMMQADGSFETLH